MGAERYGKAKTGVKSAFDWEAGLEKRPAGAHCSRNGIEAEVACVSPRSRAPGSCWLRCSVRMGTCCTRAGRDREADELLSAVVRVKAKILPNARSLQALGPVRGKAAAF